MPDTLMLAFQRPSDAASKLLQRIAEGPCVEVGLVYEWVGNVPESVWDELIGNDLLNRYTATWAPGSPDHFRITRLGRLVLAACDTDANNDAGSKEPEEVTQKEPSIGVKNSEVEVAALQHALKKLWRKLMDVSPEPVDGWEAEIARFAEEYKVFQFDPTVDKLKDAVIEAARALRKANLSKEYGHNRDSHIRSCEMELTSRLIELDAATDKAGEAG